MASKATEITTEICNCTLMLITGYPYSDLPWFSSGSTGESRRIVLYTIGLFLIVTKYLLLNY